ncbi:thiamine pyrophosphate-dependent enzyme [Bacillus ectoiniformans]|uniref:thiamine pyrophosphate-dependent enzyme n=1 Tax=Bacillus ectoiniformans TaxID=1494429 RepID=UPI001EF7CAAA|nr:thiamine pyrophosphate-dependent enzyme [Bacillus ectoiniformans]
MEEQLKKQPAVKIMSSAVAIVSCLKLEGVTKVFCVPGESYLPLMDAIYEEETMQLVSARHEGGAAFMAEGFAKATSIPGVVLATRGVGAANVAIGVHTAYQDSTPMVVFLGQVHRQFRGREGFQEVDLEQFFGPIAKWTVEIRDAERVPELVQRAFRMARTGRPGPVVISLPEDVLKQTAEMRFSPRSQKPAPAPSRDEVKQIESILKKAKRPLIIAGGGVKSANAEHELKAFSEKYSLSVIAAFRRHDVFPNHHPLYVGHLGLGTNKEVIQTVQEADVILAIGTRLSEVTTQDYSLPTKDQILIHVEIEPSVLGKSAVPDVGIIADAKQALLACMAIESDARWISWTAKRRKVYERTSSLLSAKHEEKLTNECVMMLLQEVLPENAILTNDAGNFAGWLHTYYQFKEKKTYIGPTSGAMGYGLPAAIGAKFAYPDLAVVSLSGDGGMMMTVQELETAVRYQVPVISLVFNNQMYGTIRMHQEIHYPKRVIGTELGLVSFASLAKAMGANGVRVTSQKELICELQSALRSDCPTVIEIMTDREDISVSNTIEELRQKIP